MADEIITLGLSEPYTREQLDALKSVPHPGTGGGSYVPSYGSWAEWDRALTGGFSGTRVDYALKVGDPSASSLVTAGVRWAGNTLPEPPLQVKETTGNKGESEVVANHLLIQLWRRPNKFYSGSTLMKGFANSWITKGDVYIRKVWNKARTRPVELWYEPHWLIRPRWMGDNRGNYIYQEGDDPNAFVNYYELDRGVRKYRLEVSDVIHFRDGINPETRCGENRLFSILREIYGDNEAANWFGSLMENGGVPKFILSADPDLNLTPEKQKEVSENAQRASKGDNRNKVLTLSGVKPFKLPFSPEELDLRASRYMSEDRFCAVTGIPAVELELGAGRESSIYNNVRQASERATERFLAPAWTHIAEELTVQLLPDFETGERAEAEVKDWAIKNGQAWEVKRVRDAVKAANGQLRYITHDLSKVRALQEDEDGKHERVRADYEAGIIDLAQACSALGYPTEEWMTGYRSPKAGGMTGQPQMPPSAQPDATRSVKSAPSDEFVDGVEELFDEFVPSAAGVLSAKVTNNGNGAKR